MSVGLSRTDLSDGENLKQMTHEFRAAMELMKPHDLASSRMVRWAKNWGESIIDAFQNPVIDADELAKSERDCEKFEMESEALGVAISDAISKLEDVAYADDASKSITDKIEPIMKDLEKALNE